MTREIIPAVAFDELSRVFAERATSGLRTLVIDRRAAGARARSFPPLQVIDPQLPIHLAHPASWYALIVPEQEHAYEDIEAFARAFRTWCNQPKSAALHVVPDFSKVKGAARCNEIVKYLYESARETDTDVAVGDSVLRLWRAELRVLGEAPRAVIDDPWFAHLFLSSSAAELALAQPYTALDVCAPRVPQAAARKIVTVVLDRLVVQSTRDASSEITIYVLEGTDLRETIDRFAESTELDEQADLRVVWIDQVDDDAVVEKTAVAESAGGAEDQVSPFDRYSAVDQRVRPAFVKGIMYGYSAFCVLEDDQEPPSDIAFLRDAGIVLGTSSPLIELFDD